MSGKDIEALVTLILTVILFILFTALAIWGLSFDFTRTISMLLLLVMGLAAAVVFWTILSANKKNSNVKLRLEDATALINRHVEALARERIKLIRVDVYGIADTSKWDAEIQRFIDKIIIPELFAKDFAIGKRLIDPILRNIIEEKSRLRAIAIERDLSFAKDMTPQDFERWCTKIMLSNGWKATTTKTTGDQGADVIAEKEGTRLVLQCKLYGTPVGNKAVQEAFAAQHHYRAKASAVLTNTTFTASAIALAATTGVLLLHYSDLGRLDALIGTTKTEYN